MKGLSTIILIGALVLATGLLGKIGWQNWELEDSNTMLNRQLMQANLEVGRARTEFGDAEKYIGELEGAIQEEIQDRDATLTRIGTLTAQLRRRSKKSGKAKTVYVEGPTVEVPAEINYIAGVLYQAITERTLRRLDNMHAEYEDERVKILVTISSYPNRLGDIAVEWDVDSFLRIRGVLAETRTPSGAINHYITLYEIDQDGNDVSKLELTQFNMVVTDERKPKFHLWAPHVDVGLNVGWSARRLRYGGLAGLSLMGFGLTRNDLTWRFLRLSLDVQEDLALGITPVLYNIGNSIPLVSNLWVGVGLNWSPSSSNKALTLSLGSVL